MVKQGDIIFLGFDPQAGHEQKVRRPAFVVSNNVFNKFTKAAIVCPITNTDRNNLLKKRLDSRVKTTDVIMCDQVKALDIKRHNAKYIEHAPQDVIDEVIDIVYSFVEK